MTPFKTEKEAWEYIAKLYEIKSEEVNYYTNSNNCCGICSLVDYLYTRKRVITYDQFNNMMNKIREKQKETNTQYNFIWSMTDFQSRALFAREQSKLCNFDFDIYFPSTWKVEWIISWLKERGIKPTF